jgi:alpha-glucosidase
MTQHTMRPDALTPAAPAAPWWTGAVGYQVYLRSFQDSDGDGIGDLEGVRRRLDHLVDLGIDYLWLTPFYPSPQADHGYDVADYLDVDPAYGDLPGFRCLVDDAHDRELKIVVDIVPNHTSDQHAWFQDALTGRDARHRDHYVWRDPAPDGGPPNNWVSKFGGPAWRWHDATGQYYMHTFLAEQPDLNWANPVVRAEFDRILRFWLDLGIDGFRIDTAHLLTEDAALRDNPLLRPIPTGADADTVYHCYEHRYDLDQPDVLDVYRHWQRLTDDDTLLLGEVGLFEPAPVARYVADGALDLAFYFPALKVRWDPAEIRTTLRAATDVAGDGFAWPLSSHDDPRAAQRFGTEGDGPDRARAYLTLLAGLPGSVVILQGDELGIDTTQLSAEGLRDPVAIRHPGAIGRDLSRTPMPWAVGPGFGFTPGTPWLPHPEDTTSAYTVEHQRQDPRSPLMRTRELFRIRATSIDLTGRAPIHWIDHPDPAIVAYRRGGTLVVLNTAAEHRAIAPLETRSILYSSTTPLERGGSIPANTAIIATI